MHGGQGIDKLVGGFGNNNMWGGEDTDIFVLSTEWNHFSEFRARFEDGGVSRIKDFVIGEDKIEVSGYYRIGTESGTGFATIYTGFKSDGVLHTFDLGVVENVTAEQLQNRSDDVFC